MFTVVLTIDRNAYLPSSYYPGPNVEVDEVLFADVVHAIAFLRSKLCCLGIMEGHIENVDGERIDVNPFAWF